MELINTAEEENLNVRKLGKRYAVVFFSILLTTIFVNNFRFNISKTQAAEIVKRKESIRRQWQSGENLDQKSIKLKGDAAQIDKICFEWFARARSQNIPISGPLIKAKAKEVANDLEYQNFSASDGWLNKWRRRHNISFKCISGESADVIQEDVDQFLEKLPGMLLGYKPEDIYNADESGLYFKALPDKTLTLKGEKCVGGKMSKERLTILFCANMVGEKEKLLVIGKAARPRALKNVPLNSLPATWTSNKKAWMTRSIMTDWLLDMDKRMGFQKRKILLFLDNAGSHPRELKLKNIKIIFLPPNTTSVCQPMDQGIIQNFKFFYRDQIVKHILSKMEYASSASDLSKSVNVLEALYFIKNAWNKVTPNTIQNCYAKAGFKKSVQEGVGIDYDAEDDLPLAILAEFWGNCNEIDQSSKSQHEDFINLDQGLFTEETFNENTEIENDIVKDYEVIQDSDDEEEEETSGPINSYTDALKVVEHLKRFSNEDFIAFEHLKNIESHFQNCLFQKKCKNMKQTKILDFFKK